jgi:1-acyl-sn-glycerol-3-phosphate acyltransferase
MRWFAQLLFRLSGWRTEGSVPQPLRFVIIAAPHTSNWDAVILVTAAYIFNLKLAWFIKDAAFVWPLGSIVRFFGGVPIDRSARRNVVAQAIDQFAARRHFVLAVPPEGTRKHSTHWKTGFYHIAHGARVPIVLGYIDYRRKVAALGPSFVPTGDIDADFEVFADFYASVTPKYPAYKGVVSPRPPAEPSGHRSVASG